MLRWRGRFTIKMALTEAWSVRGWQMPLAKKKWEGSALAASATSMRREC
jgi:hypothetical protein